MKNKFLSFSNTYFSQKGCKNISVFICAFCELKNIVVLFGLLITNMVMAQSDSGKISFSGYADVYYSYNTNNPANHENENFVYNFKRHNELNVNFAMVKAAYTSVKTRANLALMVGNYAQYNLSSEPTWAQFVNEANVGVKLSTTKNIWLDVGIIPSHIGFESAISADCYTLTRSIVAENSPYYETGAKITSISKNEKHTLALMYLNGWQKIQKPNYIQKPSFGLQYIYKPNDKLTLNYSNFIGSDKPDSLNATRIYHNIYGIYTPNKKWSFIAGIDIGTDKDYANNYATWYIPIFISRYTVNDKSKIALRAEYFNDEKQVMIQTNNGKPFQVFNFSLNYDYQINNSTLFRIEGKIFSASNDIFTSKTTPSTSENVFTAMMCIRL